MANYRSQLLIFFVLFFQKELNDRSSLNLSNLWFGDIDPRCTCSIIFLWLFYRNHTGSPLINVPRPVSLCSSHRIWEMSENDHDMCKAWTSLIGMNCLLYRHFFLLSYGRSPLDDEDRRTLWDWSIFGKLSTTFKDAPHWFYCKLL